MTQSSTGAETLPPSRRADVEAADEQTLHSALLWPGPRRLHRPLGAAAAERSRFRFACLPSRRAPRFLVPADPGLASAAAIHGLPRLSRLPGWARAGAAATVGRLGLLRLWPHQTVVDQPVSGESLVQHLATRLQTPVIAAARLGPPRANRKPVLELLDEDGRTRGFAKVGWNSLTTELVRGEESALSTIQSKRLTHLVIPRVIDAGTWHDLAYLLLDPVDTRPSTPEDGGARDRAMLELSGVFADSAVSLAESPYWATLRAALDALPSTAAQIASVARKLDLVADRITVIPSAWHGDWTPWNMITKGGVATVWDWERFETGVPAGYDALHFTFHHGVRRQGMTPREAIHRTVREAHATLEPFGVAGADAPAVVALYLLHLGHRHERDGQAEAGAKMGPLADWLLPEVEPLVSSVVGAWQDRPV